MVFHVKVIDVSSVTDVVGILGGAENKLKHVELVLWGLISNDIYY